MRRGLRGFFGALLIISTAAMLDSAQAQIKKISADPFSNSSSQHATEVEPDTFAFGSTIVSVFQTGRIYDGGSSDIGFSTSTDGGSSWTHGFLPGITQFYKGGHYTAVSDPSVSFDAAHSMWVVASIAITDAQGVAVISSNSSDALHWNNPVIVNNNSGFTDKSWIACDNTPTSAYYGHCYVEFDDAYNGDQVRMSVSSDGGQTWSNAANVNNAFGLGGQPVVQPNGTVVVPFEGSGIEAFTSTNGGRTWGSPVTVGNISDHGVNGGLRTSPLPSAEVDSAGTVYVVWQDCRFRSGCSANDIVMSTSADGRNWTAVSRIPIDATNSGIDHFIPGIAVDPATAGSTAHLGLTYYFYPVSNCSSSSCKLAVGFISSQDGGTTWSAAQKIAGPMKLSWLASTSQGVMVGDYISTSYVNGKGFGVFAKALQPSSKFDQAMYTPALGFMHEVSGPTFSSAGDKPIPGAHSDHPPMKYYDLDGHVPIPPSKRK